MSGKVAVPAKFWIGKKYITHSFSWCGAFIVAVAMPLFFFFPAGSGFDTSIVVSNGISGQKMSLPHERNPLLRPLKTMQAVSLPAASSGGSEQPQVSELEQESEEASTHDQLALLAVLDLRSLLRPELFNKHTLEVFQRMHIALDADPENLDDHYDSAQAYLASQLEDTEEVDALMVFYRRYTEFELGQAVEPAPLWQEAPQNAEAAIALNEAKQEYLRSYFGADIADRVWGAALQDANYYQGMLAVVRDDSYGEDADLRAQLVSELPGAGIDHSGTDPARLNLSMYMALVRNGEALLAMSDEERHQAVQSYWLEATKM